MKKQNIKKPIIKKFSCTVLFLFLSYNFVSAQETNYVYDGIKTAEKKKNQLLKAINSFAASKNDKDYFALQIKSITYSFSNHLEKLVSQVDNYRAEKKKKTYYKDIESHITAIKSNLEVVHRKVSSIRENAGRAEQIIKNTNKSTYAVHSEMVSDYKILSKKLESAKLQLFEIIKLESVNLVEKQNDKIREQIENQKKRIAEQEEYEKKRKELEKQKIDYVDGPSFSDKTYKAVRIGKQIWMATNLDIDHFKNGDKIPYAKSKEEWKQAATTNKPAWCYYNFNPKNEHLGKFYNGYVLTDPRGIAPDGWKIPSVYDWRELSEHMEKAYGEGKYLEKLKSIRNWNNYKLKNNHIPKNGTNETGFNAIPSSVIRLEEKDYLGLGYAFWWSQTKYESKNAYYISTINYLTSEKLHYATPFGFYNGLNIRLLKE
ncbi:FISUMP domain-containing protein [Winogradskyella poriferorum]|uniref:FISUMP domain-containing protein n=1 Tax=Winogradskyella poriferorum TaxID=307627 RepID=UPI003D64D74A